MSYSDAYKRAINRVHGELPVYLLKIEHPALSDSIRVARDSDDWPYGAEYQWQPGQAVTAGTVRIPSTYAGFYYTAQGGGSTGASEPAWPASIGGTVVDGGVTWACTGEQYKALAFQVTPPSQPENGRAKANLAVDNVGREITAWLEVSNGGEGAQATLMQALRSAPGVIEYAVTMDLSEVIITPTQVTGALGFEDLLNRPAVALTHRPDTTPGLF